MKSFYIATTLFTNETWKENKKWKERNNWDGCIYAVPSAISKYSRIPPEAKVYVIEMNNNTNKIMGIGVIKNKIRYNLKYKIHKNRYYNRYIYKDKSYVTREKLLKNDKRGFYKIFLKYLEKIVFRGSSHMKRGDGFRVMHLKWKRKNGKYISLPICPKIFGYYYKKFRDLSTKERLARLERIQFHILFGFNYLKFR